MHAGPARPPNKATQRGRAPDSTPRSRLGSSWRKRCCAADAPVVSVSMSSRPLSSAADTEIASYLSGGAV
jgi:hypothetical protein